MLLWIWMDEWINSKFNYIMFYKVSMLQNALLLAFSDLNWFTLSKKSQYKTILNIIQPILHESHTSIFTSLASTIPIPWLTISWIVSNIQRSKVTSLHFHDFLSRAFRRWWRRRRRRRGHSPSTASVPPSIPPSTPLSLSLFIPWIDWNVNVRGAHGGY